MRLVGEESGLTLIELLVATFLMVIVLSATFQPLNAFERTVVDNRNRNQAQARARITMDRMSRELRNISGQTQFIEKATASDLVYQTADPLTTPSGSNGLNLERVRYCLDTSTKRLWRQTQTWTTASPPALPATTSCPSSAWTTQTVAVEPVTNAARAVFTYDSATLTSIGLIHTDLYVDISSAQHPPESLLSNGISLRNQNKAPTASFTATPTANRHMLLNGATSTDPEGGSLTYKWSDGATQIGTGQTCDCIALGTGNRTIMLVVTDPGGLTASATQTVKIK